jgi:hypothetical protein
MKREKYSFIKFVHNKKRDGDGRWGRNLIKLQTVLQIRIRDSALFAQRIRDLE